MAELLLSCDDSIYLHKGNYYAASREKIEFYQRYLRIFERLRLVTRCQIEDELDNSRVPLNLEPRIEFVAIPEFHGPKEYATAYFSVGKALRDAVKGCDAAVLRIPSTVALRVGRQVLKKRKKREGEIFE